MKFSESWLREWVNPPINTAQLKEQLTQAGLEVACVEPVAKNFSGVVVGEVVATKPHPNADKLTLCQVNIGKPELLNIVCGAKNVRPSLKVAVATVGAVLPGDFNIKPAKLRGEESFGMLCSAVELSLAETSNGLLELPNDAPIGEDVRKYLKLDDQIFELEITPNRGDCLSIAGVARDVAALNQCELTEPVKITKHESAKIKNLEIKIDAKEACPRYCGRVISDINNKAVTPLWLQERLRRSGLRNINPVVDVTNYVMLELGQPLHAFDIAKINGAIHVRYARVGEKIILLDGKEVELTDNTLVIADDKNPLAIAGVIGGIDSGVTDQTTTIFVESAFFAPEKVAGKARHFGVQTDSAYRFERGVDFELQLKALERATQLLLEIVGGKISDVFEAVYPEHLPQKINIELRSTQIERILGVAIKNDVVEKILKHLGLQVKNVASGWQVAKPSWRFDINIEEDLIEEVARIYGYNLIPELPIVAALSAPTQNKIGKNRLSELLKDLGYNEIITYSFVDPKLQKILDPENIPLLLANPISPELSVMRTSLWSGLIHAAQNNLHRQQSRVRFFEIGQCFTAQNQITKIGGIAIGANFPEQWGAVKNKVDFFDLKNDVCSIIKTLNLGASIEFRSGTNLALHPKRSAQVYVDNNLIGCVGELHPRACEALELPSETSIFEMDFNCINNKLQHNVKDVPKFPSMQRDLAFIVDQSIGWQEIKRKIVDISDKLLQNAKPFDIYCGEHVGVGKKSIAVHLIFQHSSRTLVDDEVEGIVNKIISMLKQHFNAILRG